MVEPRLGGWWWIAASAAIEYDKLADTMAWPDRMSYTKKYKDRPNVVLSPSYEFAGMNEFGSESPFRTADPTLVGSDRRRTTRSPSLDDSAGETDRRKLTPHASTSTGDPAVLEYQSGDHGLRARSWLWIREHRYHAEVPLHLLEIPGLYGPRQPYERGNILVHSKTARAIDPKLASQVRRAIRAALSAEPGGSLVDLDEEWRYREERDWVDGFEAVW